MKQYLWIFFTMISCCFASIWQDASAIHYRHTEGLLSVAEEAYLQRLHSEIFPPDEPAMQIADKALAAKLRRGFALRGVAQCESVKEHSLNLARLAYVAGKRLRMTPEMLKEFVSSALVHDLAEWDAEDVVPGEVNNEIKMRDEHRAMILLYDRLYDSSQKAPSELDIFVDRIDMLWQRYNYGQSRKWRLLRLLDKVDSVLQAANYILEKQGNQARLREFFDWLEFDVDVVDPLLKPIVQRFLTDRHELMVTWSNMHSWFFRELADVDSDCSED